MRGVGLVLGWGGELEGPLLVAIGLECGLDMPDLSIFLLRFGDHAVCFVNECSYYRSLVLAMMDGVKVQILVCICGFSVYCVIQGAIIIEGSTSVQERQLAFRFRFGGELYVLINAVEVFHAKSVALSMKSRVRNALRRMSVKLPVP